MLQAMNTGHEGSMTTVHANSAARWRLTRLEMMIAMAGPGPAAHKVRAAADQLRDSRRNTDPKIARRFKRKIVSMSEITALEGELITMQDIFMFEQTGIASDGRVRDSFVRPAFGRSSWNGFVQTASRFPTDSSIPKGCTKHEPVGRARCGRWRGRAVRIRGIQLLDGHAWQGCAANPHASRGAHGGAPSEHRRYIDQDLTEPRSLSSSG